MFFSICMPVYNAAHKLQSTLDSILTQSFQDYELIACDDASTDDSYTILESFPNIHLMRNSSNMGCLITRNSVFRSANSPYTIWMDDDDTLSPDFLSTAHTILINKHYDILQFPYTVNSTPVTRPSTTLHNRDILHSFCSGNTADWYCWSKVYSTTLMHNSIPPDSRSILDDVFYGLKLHANAQSYRYEATHPMYHYTPDGTWTSLSNRYTPELYDKVCSMRALESSYNLGYASSVKLEKPYMDKLIKMLDLQSLVDILSSLPDYERTRASYILNKYFPDGIHAYLQ